MNSKMIVVSIWLPLFLSGCLKMGEIKQSQMLSIQGCVAGGLGAGALAYLKYRDDSDRNEKIAIITAIGCMGGAVVGYKVGKRTEEYASAQSAANSEIARNERTRADLQRVNASLQSNIDEYNMQIAKLQSSTFSENEKQDQLKILKKSVIKQRESAIASLSEVDAEISSANQEYQKFQGGVSAADNAAWRQKLADLQREKQILSGHVTTLNAMDTSI